MKGRSPTQADADKLLEAIGYVMAYSQGQGKDKSFPELAMLLRSEDDPKGSILALTQLCWIILEQGEEDRAETLRGIAARVVSSRM